MIETIHFQVLLATFAGWVGWRQTAVIAYLIEENRVLKEQLESGGKRMGFSDDQRRRLAAKGKPLGRKVLCRIVTIVTPETTLAWHRRLIAAKWTCPQKEVGRPGVMREIRKLIVRMAEEDPSWGYARIQGQLKHLNHRVARSTIAKGLKEQGIKPSPERPMSWRTFVRSHAHLIVAADFFTTEVWTVRGLVRHFTLFVVDIATRRVHARIVRKLDRTSALLLGDRVPTKEPISLIIAANVSSGLAAFSVNTKSPISPIWELPEKREHSEEGYSRRANCLAQPARLR